ncbi:hypothetical protein F5Y10DRAFT_290027 [Nemania abortiva]|nr:hypothetical protein F5Y10DRAFT_290027 [Nemania abortiva]
MILSSSFSVVHTAATSHNSTLVGWVDSSTDRGTIDILWSCSITILLCCWVATHPNAAAPTDKWYHRYIDKFTLAWIGLEGPEFLFGIALGQLSSARRCVKLFRKDNHLCNGVKLTYRHAFFLDMGGMHLTSPDFPNGFPINGQQLHYLVKHGHVDFPDMTAMAIDERNSADTLSRLFTVWQVLWFSVTVIQRARNGLPTTTLELTTLNFVVVMIATSICWFRKPAITTPQSIPTKNEKRMCQIRSSARYSTHPDLNVRNWHRTPMDFIHDDRWGISIHQSYFSRFVELMHLKIIVRPPTLHPWDRFISEQWLPPEKVFIPFGLLGLLFFGSSFLIAWNFYFPTKTEQWLWRASAIYHLAFIVWGGMYYIIESLRWDKARHKEERERTVEEGTIENSYSEQTLRCSAVCESHVHMEVQTPRPDRIEPPSGRLYVQRYRKANSWIGSWRNISAEGDPEMATRLRFLLPTTFMFALYILTRFFFYIDDLASLRHQPAGIYQSVNRYIPFLGDG